MKSVRQTDKDELLMKLIAKEITRKGGRGDCPSDEELAVFLEGSLAEQERCIIMGHMAGCAVCRAVVREAQTAGMGPVKAAGGQKWPRMRFIIPLAAAAMVLLFVSLRDGIIHVQVQKEAVMTKRELTPIAAPQLKSGETAQSKIYNYKLLQAAEIAMVIASGGVQGQAADAVRNESAAVYGFAGAGNSFRHAFRIGVLIMDIEVLLRADDAGKTEQLTKELRDKIYFFDEKHRSKELLDRMSEELTKGTKPSLLLKKSREIALSLDELPYAHYMRFGIWAEGNRLGMLTGTMQFLSTGSIEHFSRLINGSDLPQQVQESLAKLWDIKNRNNGSLKALREAERELQNIIEVVQ